jgi:hypothetical protein
MGIEDELRRISVAAKRRADEQARASAEAANAEEQRRRLIVKAWNEDSHKLKLIEAEERLKRAGVFQVFADLARLLEHARWRSLPELPEVIDFDPKQFGSVVGQLDWGHRRWWDPGTSSSWGGRDPSSGVDWERLTVEAPCFHDHPIRVLVEGWRGIDGSSEHSTTLYLDANVRNELADQELVKVIAAGLWRAGARLQPRTPRERAEHPN